MEECQGRGTTSILQKLEPDERLLNFHRQFYLHFRSQSGIHGNANSKEPAKCFFRVVLCPAKISIPVEGEEQIVEDG